jgi:hypothetical protein
MQKVDGINCAKWIFRIGWSYYHVDTHEYRLAVRFTSADGPGLIRSARAQGWAETGERNESAK